MIVLWPYFVTNKFYLQEQRGEIIKEVPSLLDAFEINRFTLKQDVNYRLMMKPKKYQRRNLPEEATHT